TIPNSIEARDLETHLHSYSNPHRNEQSGPLVITCGEGIHVFDQEGRRYLEGVASLWYASLGFSEKRLIEAARRQMDRLPCYHSFGNKVSDVAIELADKLLSIAPVPMARVYFACSGSEANDSAFKIARFFNNALGRPAKKKVISRFKGYHGTTVVTASLT